MYILCFNFLEYKTKEIPDCTKGKIGQQHINKQTKAIDKTIPLL